MELARQMVTEYGYLAVFLGTFLEGELVLLTAAVAASRGLLSPPLVVACAAAGAWTGHLVFFRVGRWKGRDWLFGHPRLGTHAREADRVIVRHGWTGVFILQYLYGARIAGALVFGLSTFPMARFLAIQAVNCVTWAALVTAVGYLLGASLSAASRDLSIASAVAVVVLLALILRLAARRRRARRLGRGGPGGREP